MNTLKEELFRFCTEFVKSRISRITSSIDEIEESLQSETKSSAGDKHETGRAMIQLEREKLGAQLAEAERMLQIVSRIVKTGDSNKVVLGSLVFTNAGNYYLSVSAGEFKNSELSVFCISAATPIGKLLLGKEIGNQISFRDKNITVLEIK
ncbi:3-oxoacyl-ACP synthase [Cytophaga sp. FL35]|uniref:3-oxoacyl-ACP synthase n=1 Tax=Cytophaga sp. FL35 TaxID=1904456 RepID=UPI0016535B7D|nr:3-oxoacyl-ACP synthase [Cytophaga sp. FL35]MBC6999095.1 3-oxoacyl-ACP synthase [Cytophaga sp. FL35]